MANQDSEVSRSEVIYPAAMANGEASKSMVPATPIALPAIPPLGGFLPRGPEILTGSFNQMWLINCLRRKWLSAVLLGAIAAVLAGVLLLFLFPVSSSVTAQLELKAIQEGPSYGKTQTRPLTARESDFFQESQLALFKSQFVLKAALAPRAISELEAVIKEGDDAVTWLTDGLKIGFHGDILQIQYDGEESSEDMVKIVNAVIQAYKDEVLAKERNISVAKTDVLRELRDQTRKELKDNIDRHQKLAKELGGGADTQLANTMLAMLRSEIHTINLQISKAEEELLDLEVGKTLAMQEARSPVAMEAAVEDALAQDPMMANFKDEKYAMAQRLRQLQATTRGGNSKQIKSLSQGYQQIEMEEKRYRKVAEGDIRDKLKQAPNDGLSALMAEYVMRKEGTTKKLAELRVLYQEKMEDVLSKGEKSGAVALLESEIDQLREVVREMDFQLRSEDVIELTASERVRVMQPALPREKINELARFTIAILGGIAAFCATCYGVALLEFRSRRLNDPVDVDEGLGIRVLGVLPSVSSRKAMAQGSSVAAQLSESIDNVRATLMHEASSRPRQVVLVTSPASMEGCTTVASHLALSLSRAGRRTLLVDGDLREPALHKLFGMPVEDGLSEMLRSEIEVSDAIRPTNTKGLWLITAGQCDMEAIHALAADQLQPIFEKLRAEFDFIIIDGAPVLSLADSLSIGQHVDGAILTVLRDHSSIPQIHKASELLKSMGIHLIGSVVNGVASKADRRVARLHGIEAQRQRQLPAAERAATERATAEKV